MSTLLDLIRNLNKQGMGPQPSPQPLLSNEPDEDELQWQNYKKQFSNSPGLTSDMQAALDDKERFKMLKSKFTR